jgi:CDP-diacylglycerol--glycerol-3-phosphate 3-phosphatidyltransferase
MILYFMLPPHLKHKLPNWLTISRVLVILPIALLLHWSDSPVGYIAVMLLFCYACATDWWDGYLARKWKCSSDMGRLLDPVADKLLVAVLLIMLCAKGVAHPLAVSAIMVREVFISGLREFMQERHIIVHVSTLAKCKTALQMFACWMFLWAGIFPQEVRFDASAQTALWCAMILTIWTGWDYFRAASRSINP